MEQTNKDTIINNLMISKGLYCLVSNAKVGKYMFALQLSNALAKNKQFLGHSTTLTPVLYVSTESDRNQIKDRCKLLGIDFPKSYFFIIDKGNKGKKSLFDIEYELKCFAEEHKGKLVIIDMLKDFYLGISYDINSYQDVGQKLLPKLKELCEKYNFAILFTHHLNKKGTVLGSTAFDAVVDGKFTSIENKNDKSLIILNTINRDFVSLDIQLQKNDNQVFSVVEIVEDDDIDNNLISIIKLLSIYR